MPTADDLRAEYRQSKLRALDDLEQAIQERAGSPIEELLVWAIIKKDCHYNAFDFPSRFVLGGDGDKPSLCLSPLGSLGEYEPVIFLQPTVVVGDRRYRLDIAYMQESAPPWRTTVSVAVECDGHDFHEKTREQAEADKRRDRDLQSIGWIVARFTGSEIFRDPIGTAKKIHALAWKIYEARHAEEQRISRIIKGGGEE